jgi:hypothetical protein
MNEKSFEGAKISLDLDVLGTELDDTRKNIGSKNEQNKYYSEADTK